MATTNSAVSIADTPPPKRRKRGWNPFRVGDKPFFEDKNRAFWVLQSIGWSGYFFLRTLSNIANEKIASYLIHNALLTAAGYSITLLMASAYRRLVRAGFKTGEIVKALKKFAKNPELLDGFEPPEEAEE